MKPCSAFRLGVLARVAGALCTVLIALAGLALLAVRSTRDATDGADQIESEFAERVKSGTALATALVNFSIAQERLLVTTSAAARTHELELAESDAKLAQQIVAALTDPNHEVAQEAGVVGQIRRAYPRYLRVRDRLLRTRARGVSAESLDPTLDRAFEPLHAGLQSYADVSSTVRTSDFVGRSGGEERRPAP